MENENRIEENVTQENETSTPEYISQKIKELKQNTVSKEEYEKVVHERDTYLNSLINDNKIEDDKSEVNLEDLKNACEEPASCNLDFVEKRLNYRNATLENTGVDMFGPNGNEVAEGLTYAVNEANGDPNIFNAILKNIIKDPIMPQQKTTPQPKKIKRF